MRRRGEISMEVIIIAAIALLVLVILSVILLRKGIGFNQGTSCVGLGGTCEDRSSGCDGLGSGYVASGNDCPNTEQQVCCMPLLGGDGQ